MKHNVKRIFVCLLAVVISFIAIATPVYAATKTADTKAYYSAAKLKKKFGSKTNPAKGEKPVSIPKPAVKSFIYGDFATFNSSASENKLGGTPIYLLGTVKSVEKFAITGDIYYTAFLIDDFEGYQWLGAMDVPSNTFDKIKSTYTGMTAYIYGTYDGYSNDLSRPIINVGLISDASGIAAIAPTAAAASVTSTAGAIASSAATTTVQPTATTSSSADSNNTQLRSDNMVYITPTGSKYHYDKECAGKSAIPKYLNDVKSTYQPCGTCVLK